MRISSCSLTNVRGTSDCAAAWGRATRYGCGNHGIEMNLKEEVDAVCFSNMFRRRSKRLATMSGGG